MSVQLSREVRLVRRAEGAPGPDNARVVETKVACGDGQVLVRNLVMSVEPYMRGRMGERTTYVAPYDLDAPMEGHAVGIVEESDSAEVPVGATVLHEAGWREYAVLDASAVQVLPEVGEPADYLGALGQTGMTAWVGLNEIARMRAGDVVFISSAAGGVGAVAGQLAKAAGCTVIGSCGSVEKAARAEQEFGFDVCFDYHAGSAKDLLRAALKQVDADGLDIYFDNVGGEQLEAAIGKMREGGRIALCGAISVYDATAPVPGPSNLLLMIWRRLTMRGFLVGDHLDRTDDFRAEMASLLASGAVRNPTTVVGTGIDEAYPGFLAMLRGGGVGKSLVTLGERS